MPGNGAEDGTDDGGEVEEAWEARLTGKILGGGREIVGSPTEIVRCEFIDAGEPDGDGGIDADDPGEVEEIVYGAKEDGKFGDRFDRTHEGLETGLAFVSAVPLFNA